MANKKIGLATGGVRDFATMAAYSSYLNALTLTAPETFEVYNDGGPVADTTLVVLSGWAGGSSTNTVTGRPAAGQGFRDNTNVLTNALRFNAANGAALTNSTNAGGTGAYTFGSWVIIDGLQIATTHTGAPDAVALSANCTLRNSILSGSSTGAYVLNMNGTGITLENSILYTSSAAAYPGLHINASGGTVTNCLIVIPAGSASAAIKCDYATAVFKNTVAYGGAADMSTAGAAGGATGSTNNATKSATFSNAVFGTAGQTNVTSADFVSLTAGAEDFRVASGSTKLKGNGATVGPTVGIRGNTRSAPYTIGADQYVGAAPTPSATVSYTEANDTSAITANVTTTSVAATISYTEANDTSAITANVASSTGAITTAAFKNNTGSVLASLTALTVTILNASTLAFVKTFTNQTTNASGVMALTDALLVSGTQYAVVTTNASGTLGVEKYTAA